MAALDADFRTGVDGFTFTSSGQTFSDWEAVSKTVGANVPAIQGGRVTTNLLPDPESATLWEANGTTPPTIGGATTHLGVSVLQTITFDTSMTSTGYNGCRADTSNAAGIFTVTTGNDYRYSVEICFSRELVVGEEIRFNANGISFSAEAVFDENDTMTAWQRVANNKHDALATGSEWLVIHQNETVNSELIVYVRQALAEDVTNQIDHQNPSSYTANTSYSLFENGNTLSSNIVTEALGSALTTIDGILLETGVSMTKAVTVPANNFTVTIVFTPNFANTDDKTTDRPLLELSDGTANNVFSIDFDQTNDQFHLTKTVAAASAVAETIAGDILYVSGDEITLSIASTAYGAHIKANALPWVTVAGTTAELDWSTLLNQIELFPPDVAIKSVTLTNNATGAATGIISGINGSIYR